MNAVREYENNVQIFLTRMPLIKKLTPNYQLKIKPTLLMLLHSQKNQM
jgi:hypothetical protein